MKILNNSKRIFGASGLIFLIVGILMCIWPVGTTGMMCVLAGIALFAGGAWKCWEYFRKKNCAISARLDFLTAALQLMLGLVMVIRTREISGIVPFILAVLVLVNGVFQVQIALELKEKKSKGWWYYLAACGVCAAVALVMMFDPFENYRLVSTLMGVAFILDGVTDLWTVLYLQGWLEKIKLM